MSSPVAAAGGVLPALPPIKTRAAVDACASSSASPSTVEVEVGETGCTARTEGEVVEEAEPTTTAAAAVEEAEPTTTAAAAVEEAEPTTPTSEGSKLRTPAECPPAPRKPAWTTMPAARRKAASTSSTSSSSSSPRPSSAKRRAFFDVPRDLSAVFRSLPPKKRIRAG